MRVLTDDENTALTDFLCSEFGRLPAVQAIAMGGSRSSDTTDAFSDTDIYIYVSQSIPVDVRLNILRKIRTSKIETGLTFWDEGDAFIDKISGMEFDLMYWHTAWFEDQMKRVLIDHQASLGYSTCHWYTLLNSRVLFERDHWLTHLRARYSIPYPEALRRAIIAKNHPVLRTILSSYYTQIDKALKRDDMISVNHRIAALLASYFDILFALNRVPHPGEKRILRHIIKSCSNRPSELESMILNVLSGIAPLRIGLLKELDLMMDDLDYRLLTEGLTPESFY